MISKPIPGFGALRLQHLVLDYNGTLALDGRLLPAVRPRLRALGERRTACIGNGRNDRLMLRAARIGIAVLGREASAAAALAAADVVAPSIEVALDLLLKPLRLTATLRA